jgi:transcriptional regulator with XRE-family HTH domain
VKAARALLGWSAHDLAREAGVSYPTIARLEAADAAEVGGRASTVQAIRAALEAAGVEFIPGGTRLREAADQVVALERAGLDMVWVAEAYGFDYQRASTVGELEQALTQPHERPLLIEVPLER